ncbi:MAG TPA: heparan-alpha-glucosaminide N-acetyltransferase domain-containing protein [Puia sp.]
MPKPAALNQRIYSIDILRGTVMIIMALDHVRDYFHQTASLDSPTNLLTTTPLLFFTRWITHFCAPTFVFLAGVSAYLSGRKKNTKDQCVFLLKRGLWLIFIEVAIVTLGWTFDPLYHVLILQVIWAIGISMIILGLMIWLPVNVILCFGLLIICFHNLLDYEEITRNGQVGILWDLMHHGNFEAIKFAPEHIFLLIYPYLPWTGIMLLGYGIGKIFTGSYSPGRRRKILFMSGSVFFLVFFILRSYNHYGDPVHWGMQRTQLFSWLSFINLTKYPPSLDYIALTIGVAMILLGFLDRVSNKSFAFIKVFGRVPFFFYVLHIYLIHTLAVVLFFIQGYTQKDIAPQHTPFYFRPDQFGFGLAGVYLLWFAVIMILYPLCKWYDNYKTTHIKWWLAFI